MRADRPEILFVVDAPNWAHDFKTGHLASALGDEFRVTMRYQDELTDDDLDRADLILVYYWLQIDRLPDRRAAFERNRDRLLIGVCSHRELDGDWRAPGLAMLAELPRAIFAVNRRLADECGELLDVPVYYTPNGVATDLFRPRDARRPALARLAARAKAIVAGRTREAGPLRVGWAGSLGNHGPAHRGFDDLIVPAVAAVDGAELVLAVRERSQRGRDEMPEFYRSLDVYLCASLNEGTPNPCLEAAACGVPIVTTRVGCMPELVRDGENGLFVERDAARIAEALVFLRDHPARRAALGRSMLASIGAWDWRRLAENYRRMIRDVLAGQTARGG